MLYEGTAAITGLGRFWRVAAARGTGGPGSSEGGARVKRECDGSVDEVCVEGWAGVLVQLCEICNVWCDWVRTCYCESFCS